MSTTLKKTQLKFLKALGFKYLKANSNFNVPYLVCLGDYCSENPFFKPGCNTEEIIASVAWCMDKDRPVIFDIGAHCGYLSTHFAALLKKNNPCIYSFEPVMQTYFDLVKTVNKLDLKANVFPIHAAVSDIDEMVTLTYSKKYSMLAQVIAGKTVKERPPNGHYFTIATTVNKLLNELGVSPDLIKLDVEGYESFVLRGASDVLNSNYRPAICIEWNPATLEQCGSSGKELANLLNGYEIYYLNDYELGKKKFMERIDDMTTIPWVCNLFALPPGKGAFGNWKNNIEKIKSMHNISIS